MVENRDKKNGDHKTEGEEQEIRKIKELACSEKANKL